MFEETNGVSWMIELWNLTKGSRKRNKQTADVKPNITSNPRLSNSSLISASNNQDADGIKEKEKERNKTLHDSVLYG